MYLSATPFTAKITAKTSSGGFWLYSWTEQLPVAAGTGYADADTARTGTSASSPAYERNNREVQTNTLVRMYVRSFAGGMQVHEFDAPDGTLSGGGTVALTVEEVDGSPSYTLTSIIAFDQADGFVVSKTGSTVRVDISPASASTAGVVTTGVQTLGGVKTFNTDVNVLGYLWVDTQLYVGGDSNANAYGQFGHTASVLYGYYLNQVDNTVVSSWTLDSGGGFAAVGGASAGYKVSRSGVVSAGGDATTGGLTFVGGLYISGTAPAAYTDEQAQDAVGSILTDSSSIDFTYDDAGGTITAVVKPLGVTNAMLAGSIDLATKVTGLLPVASLPALTGLTAADIALADELAVYSAAAAANRKVTYERAAGFALRSVADGRLTLVTGDALGGTVTDQSAKTSLYYTPFLGTRISLYDGTRWKLYTFAQVTLASPSLTLSLPYDVWLYDNAGTLTLEITAWAGSATRNVALTTQDGVYVKSGSTTRRYLGTILPSATNQMSDTKAWRGVWNLYNQVQVALNKVCSGSGYTYSTNTIRYANNDAANSVSLCCGLAGMNAVSLKFTVFMTTTVSVSSACIMIGLDGTTDNSTGFDGSHNVRSDFSAAFYDKAVGAGGYVLNANERGAGSGTQTWFPQSGGSLCGTWMC